MSSSASPLTSPTGANQYSDTSYALPSFSAGAGAGSTAEKTGYEMFSASPLGTAAPATPSNTPGVVPPTGLPVNTTLPPGIQQGTGYTGPYDPNNPIGGPGGVKNVGSGAETVTSLFPQFTGQFANMLASQLGKGATPFDLSALLPSSGSATTPGALSAPLTQLLQQLQQFYSTGKGGPAGTDTLQSMSQTGNPTDATPAWNAMVAAEQKNTDRNASNLREQFASAGDLQSSPFANAITDFYNQNTLNQNAQLTTAEQAAQEAAAGRKLSASSDLVSGATGLGTNLQSMDQQAIQNMLAEFIRTSPDYSPLLGAQGGLATTFPPTISGSVGTGGVGSAIGSAGTALSGIADLWSALGANKSGGGATPPGIIQDTTGTIGGVADGGQTA